MTIDERILEMKKKGFGYRDIEKSLHVSNSRICKVLREAGMIGAKKSKSKFEKKEQSSALNPVTYEDIMALKVKIKAGTRIKVRTEKGINTYDESGCCKVPSKFRTGIVTSAKHNRFLTVKYQTGVVESFLWSEVVTMIRKGKCAIVKG